MPRAASTVAASGVPEPELDGPRGPGEGDEGVAGARVAGAGSIDAGGDGSPAIGGWNRDGGHPVKREAPRDADRRAATRGTHGTARMEEEPHVHAQWQDLRGHRLEPRPRARDRARVRGA